MGQKNPSEEQKKKARDSAGNRIFWEWKKAHHQFVRLLGSLKLLWWELRQQGNFEFAGELDVKVKKVWPKGGGGGNK